MARFVLDHSPEAEDELAALVLNSAPALGRQITQASDSIDAQLVHADLLPNYRRRRGVAPKYKLFDFPLLAVYEVDEISKTVKILHYRLMPRAYGP